MVQTKTSPESVAFVGDCIVGIISGKRIPVLVDPDRDQRLFPVPESIPVPELFPVPSLSIINSQLSTIPELSTINSQLSIALLYTFRYSSKDLVRRNASGICPPIERNPRSHDDFIRKSLDVELLTLSVIFSLSPSRSKRMRIFPERDHARIYPVSVSIFATESPHD